MRFINDSQRKAVFASLNRFSEGPRFVKVETPVGTMIAKKEFIEEMQENPIVRTQKKKGIVDIIKEEGGVPDKFDPTKMSLRPIEDIKSEYSDIWEREGSYDSCRKDALKFLRRHAKSKREDVSKWANNELNQLYADESVEREERMMEDPSKGRDPDYFRSEEDMRWQAEQDYLNDNYSKKPECETALQLAKNTYTKLLDNPNMTPEESKRASAGFLRDLMEEKDTAVQNWASNELKNYSMVPKKRRTVKQMREDAEVEEYFDEVEEYFDAMEKAEAAIKAEEDANGLDRGKQNRKFNVANPPKDAKEMADILNRG